MKVVDPSALTEKRLADIGSVRELLVEMVATGKGSQAVEMIIDLLVQMRDSNVELRVRLQNALKHLYGRKSEKISVDQLQLFLALLGDDATLPEPPAAEPAGAPDGQAAPDAEPAPEPAPKPPAPRRGRKPLPTWLLREVVPLEPTPAERVCAKCGTEKVCIGHEVSEVLEFVPSTFKIIEFRRTKLACKPCGNGVVIGPVGDRVIETGLPGPGLLAHVVVTKYQDACPLYRLHGIYLRSGVDISPSTLGDWVTAGAELLQPLALLIEERVLVAYLLSNDDTGVRVLDREHPNGVKKGHLWGYVGDGKEMAFKFTPSWEGKWPQAFLQRRTGFIQGDGYAGIDALFVASATGEAPKRTRVGCWMHARRPFVEALESGDARASIAVSLIRDIYAIEARAKAEHVDHAERLHRRQTQSRPIVDKLGHWVGQIHPLAVPKSPLGKATTYAINQWPTLLVPFTDGRLEIDNGEVERQLRRVATGRKNWLFCGSEEGGHRAATIFTLIASAIMAGLDPLAYLTHVLTQISQKFPRARYPELLPLAFAAAHQEAKQPDAQQLAASPS